MRPSFKKTSFDLCLFVLVGAGLLCSQASCTDPQSERCKKVCRQETECAALRKVQEENYPYDLDECVAACVALERDNEGRYLVEEHVKCANKAEGNCDQLLQCR